jgi:EmrB/QacA subfamily drug resistance transporter
MKILNDEKKRKWWVLAAMAAALSMIFLDQSAIPVTLPQMQRDFNTSDIMLQWIVNAYLLALASMVILGGKICDRVGARKVFLAGVMLFIFSSILCAVAPTAPFAVCSRFLQGIGAAFMIPATSVLVFNAFPLEERGKAIGIYIAAASVFLSFGPLLGGLLTSQLSWRWVFWLNFPISIICISLTLYAVPKISSADNTLKKIPLDWTGFICMAAAISCLVAGLMEAATYGWASPLILSLLSSSILLMGLFVYVEKKALDPIVNFTIFKNKVFLQCVLLLLIMQSAFIAIVFLALFLQKSLGYSAQMSGLLLLPSSLPIILMAPLGGQLCDRYGAKLPVTLGTGMLLLSAIWLAVFCWFLSYQWLLPGIILFGCGASFIISNTIRTAMATVDQGLRGSATGITSGVRQLGGAIGLALIGSAISNLDQSQLKHFLIQAPTPLAHIQVEQLDGLLAGAEKAVAVVSQLPADLNTQVYAAVINAHTLGYSAGMTVVAVLALLGFLLARKLPNK